MSIFAARIGSFGAVESVLLGRILGQIKEILLAALTFLTPAILKQTSSFRHASSNNTPIHHLIICELPLPSLHHLINTHVLFELQLTRLVVYKSLILAIIELSLMTCLSTPDSLQLRDGVWGHFLRFLLFLLLFLIIFPFDLLAGYEALFDPFRTVAIDLGIPELLQRGEF